MGGVGSSVRGADVEAIVPGVTRSCHPACIEKEIMSMTSPNRIDVHQHVLPPRYAGWLRENGIRPGGIDLPEWSPPAALKFMDGHGIAAGVLSAGSRHELAHPLHRDRAGVQRWAEDQPLQCLAGPAQRCGRRLGNARSLDRRQLPVSSRDGHERVNRPGRTSLASGYSPRDGSTGSACRHTCRSAETRSHSRPISRRAAS